MKKLFYLMAISFMMILASCSDDDDTATALMNVKVKLTLPAGVENVSLKDVPVTFTSGEIIYDAKTAETGVAEFTVPAGVYTAAATSTQVIEGNAYYTLNAVKENITVNTAWETEKPVVLEMVASKASQVIIKEIYTGGTTNPETQKTENTDHYITLYNNSPEAVSLKNLAIGNTGGNAYAPTTGFVQNGVLTYENEDWIPVSDGTFYFPEELSIEPYTDVVVVLRSAIDHTQTNKASVDLSNADYVCYDPQSGYADPTAYKAPSSKIPSNHYLKAAKWGVMPFWFYSDNTPAFFIYQAEGKTVSEYFADASLDILPPLVPVPNFKAKKMSRSWILDAVDTYGLDFIDMNYKRMTTELDAGYVFYTLNKGYSIYRNVDKAATEAIPGNSGKLVYNYALGTQDIENGSTDKSGIDAEASMKNGAKIVYMDTNNSTNDFHLRKECAQRAK